MTRREFTVGAAAAALSAPDAALARKPEPIIDTHQHLWDASLPAPPWVPAEGPLAGSHSLARYNAETAGLGIERTIYMEIAVRDEDLEAEAEAVVALCKGKHRPLVGAVIGGRPSDPAFEGYLRKHASSSCVKGVRQVLHGATPQGTCLRPDFVRGIRLLGERGLCFDICLPAAFLSDGAALADACPATRLVLDHCGNPNVQAPDQTQWRRDIDALAKRANVSCKISGLVSSVRKGAWAPEDLAPFVEHCARAFGPDRIVFGGDWPVCTLGAELAEWVRALRQIIAPWPVGYRRKLLRENAIKIYRL